MVRACKQAGLKTAVASSADRVKVGCKALPPEEQSFEAFEVPCG